MIRPEEFGKSDLQNLIFWLCDQIYTIREKGSPIKGLAAPEKGFYRSLIVVDLNETPKVDAVTPLCAFCNPIIEVIETQTLGTQELCYSENVKKKVLLKAAKKIRFTAQNFLGDPFEGVFEGAVALRLQSLCEQLKPASRIR